MLSFSFMFCPVFSLTVMLQVVSEEEFLAVAVSYANGTLPGGNLQALSEHRQFKNMGWVDRVRKSSQTQHCTQYK